MHYLKYSQVELNYITNNFLKETDEHIAWMLNRTAAGIRDKRYELGLVKKGFERETVLQEYSDNNSDIRQQIKALVNFIELTPSVIWRDIANTKRKDLIKYLNRNKI